MRRLCVRFRHAETGIYARSGEERVLLFLPMYHMFGIMVMLTALADGNTLIVMAKYNVNQFVNNIKLYKVKISGYLSCSKLIQRILF